MNRNVQDVHFHYNATLFSLSNKDAFKHFLK